jgi:hypothetical protein
MVVEEVSHKVVVVVMDGKEEERPSVAWIDATNVNALVSDKSFDDSNVTMLQGIVDAVLVECQLAAHCKRC